MKHRKSGLPGYYQAKKQMFDSLEDQLAKELKQLERKEEERTRDTLAEDLSRLLDKYKITPCEALRILGVSAEAPS